MGTIENDCYGPWLPLDVVLVQVDSSRMQAKSTSSTSHDLASRQYRP